MWWPPASSRYSPQRKLSSSVAARNYTKMCPYLMIFRRLLFRSQTKGGVKMSKRHENQRKKISWVFHWLGLPFYLNIPPLLIVIDHCALIDGSGRRQWIKHILGPDTNVYYVEVHYEKSCSTRSVWWAFPRDSTWDILPSPTPQGFVCILHYACLDLEYSLALSLKV